MTVKQKAVCYILVAAVLFVWCIGGYVVGGREVAYRRGLWTPTPTSTSTPAWLKYVRTPLPTPDHGSEFTAIVECRGTIREQLLVPRSAKFDSLGGPPEVDYEDGVWHIMGKVEAQNAYGVMLPGQYYCEVQYVGGRYTVLVADLL